MSKFLICLLGGWFGLHKFLEGKKGLGVLYLLTLGLCGIGWLVDTVKYLLEWLNSKPKAPVIDTPVVCAPEPVVSGPVVEVKAPEPISPEQFDKMKNMCIDIHKEYKTLLKSYSDADTDERVYILKECYRKLDVMETTINKYDCYSDIDIYDEREKIEKKAKSFINAYIKEERENGSEDYEIDVTQFSDNLDFIWDYITEKDEKLNKI